MSKLQELIKELCPDGVEFRKLGEVCEFINGFAFKSSLFKDEGLPIIRITNINGISIDLSDVKFFDSRDYKSNLQSFSVSFGDILIAMSGATTGKIGYYDNEDIAYLNQRVGKFVPNVNVLNNRYLFHFLLSKTSELYIMAGGGAQPNLSSNKLMNELYIPLPPLEIQNEIVRILDTFTSHTAELQAELQARKEQYEYYRNKLLTFDENDERVKWMTLGEVSVNVCSGGTPSTSNKKYYQGHIPWLRTQEVDWKDVFYTKIKISEDAIKNSSAKIIPPNCVIVAMYGATAGKTCINKIPLTTNQACCNLEINKDIALYKYVYYWLYKEYYKLKALGEGSQSNISGKKIKSYAIPIPPLSEQQRIVSILDKFESLVNDLSEGLPAEIAVVQEQYEYYRNKLLTFKRKS